MSALPPDLFAAITTWATDNSLDAHQAARIIRDELAAKNPMASGIVVLTGDSTIITTNFDMPSKNQHIRTASVIPKGILEGTSPVDEVLRYRNDFHTDGTICDTDCTGQDHEHIEMYVGKTYTVGQWAWTAMDKTLTGICVSLGNDA